MDGSGTTGGTITMMGTGRGRAITRRAGGALSTATVVTALVAGAIVATSARSRAVDLGTGNAWFPSVRAGLVALLDGTTASRITTVRLPDVRPGAPLTVVQSDQD